MMDDFLRLQVELQAEQSALGKIQHVLQQFGKSLTDFGLPPLEEALAEVIPNAEEMAAEARNIRPRLNPQQLTIADTILNALANIEANEHKVFFISGSSLR